MDDFNFLFNFYSFSVFICNYRSSFCFSFNNESFSWAYFSSSRTNLSYLSIKILFSSISLCVAAPFFYLLVKLYSSNLDLPPITELLLSLYPGAALYVYYLIGVNCDFFLKSLGYSLWAVYYENSEES